MTINPSKIHTGFKTALISFCFDFSSRKKKHDHFLRLPPYLFSQSYCVTLWTYEARDGERSGCFGVFAWLIETRGSQTGRRPQRRSFQFSSQRFYSVSWDKAWEAHQYIFPQFPSISLWDFPDSYLSVLGLEIVGILNTILQRYFSEEQEILLWNIMNRFPYKKYF